MKQRLSWVACLGIGVLALAAPVSKGAVQIFNISADGIKEVNSSGVSNGDPDGSAIGTLTLDTGTGSGNTGSAIFNLTLTNVDPTLAAHHIHQGPPTSTGGVVLDFGNPNSILTGTSTAGTLSGTVSNLSSTTIQNILNNPSAFYYNLHSTPNFPGGAVRDQLPEPAGLGLVGIGGIVLLRRGRR